ncbi:MAG: hypothetical protein ACO1SV_13545 [Fimbriimonas sp.]
MKRPPLTRRQKERVTSASRFVYRLELVLDFDRPVTYARGRETARKILDALDPAARGCESPEAFAEATLKCPELRRLLKISLDPPRDEVEDA